MIVKKTYPVLGMMCASCAAHVETALRNRKGVVNVAVNLAANSALIDYNQDEATAADLRKTVQDAGYDMLVDEQENGAEYVDEIRGKESQKLKKHTVWAISLSVPIVIISMFFMNMPYASEIEWALATPVLFWFGRSFFINAWRQATHRSVTMDTLVALSTGVAYLFSLFNTLFPSFWLKRGVQPHVYFEAAAVIIAFISLGKWLEERAKGSASSAIKQLMGLQPKMVTIIHKDGKQEEIAVEKVQKGDILLVKPGEKIAVDGVVTGGASFVDESMLSGEAIPVAKLEESLVLAGTVNQKGSFTFRAEKVGLDTMLAQIIRMVQQAQGSKAPVQKLADKIAGIFVPVVIGIALLAFVVWIIFAGGDAFAKALLALVTVLIVACPCALGLATPTAIMAGIGKGAKSGILIKDAESLETAKRINAVILDKTGTITEGKPEVNGSVWLDEKGKKDILHAIEQQSEHPLAEAIVRAFPSRQSIPVSLFENVIGKGVKAEVGGDSYVVGNKEMLDENGIKTDRKLLEKAGEYAEKANSVVWFANSREALAVIAVSDAVKPTSKEAVRQLQQMGIEVYMLTGDNEATAKAIAAQTGILHYRAGMLPRQKEAFVRMLQAGGKTVAMAGDGINDSAALAAADVSIAMGHGSDIAMETAKMTIISSDLAKLPEAVRLSKETVKVIRQNLFWAFFYNVIGIPVAAGILYPVCGFLLNPMIAGAAMALSSVSVVSNSLRLKWKK